MKPETTQKAKLVHSLNEQQDVLANQSSVPNTQQPSGLTKIASLFGNHRSRTSAVMLGLALSMGMSSIPANYPDTVAAAETAANLTASGNRSIDSTTHSSNGYVDQLRNDVSVMQAHHAQRQQLVAQAFSPRAYPSSVANRTDTNDLNFNGEASVSIDVAPPKTKTFRSVATTSPYANPYETGSDGEGNPENRHPGKTGETTLAFSWPAAGTITSRFGRRWGRMHKGIDIAGPVGTPINAAADGIVTAAGWHSGGYGNLVEIRHSDGTTTRYGHNSRLSVSIGQVVRQGQQIAQMGSTGRSTGSHLHFEIRPSGGSAVNPIALLAANI